MEKIDVINAAVGAENSMTSITLEQAQNEAVWSMVLMGLAALDAVLATSELVSLARLQTSLSKEAFDQVVKVSGWNFGKALGWKTDSVEAIARIAGRLDDGKKLGGKAMQVLIKANNTNEARNICFMLENSAESMDMFRRGLDGADNTVDLFRSLKNTYDASSFKVLESLNEHALSRILFLEPEYVDDVINFYPQREYTARLLNSIDNPANLVDPDYIKIVQNRYTSDLANDVNDWAAVFGSRNGAARSAEDIAIILKNNPEMRPNVIARISETNYTSFTDPRKPFAWVLDPAEIQGLNNRQIMQRLGWKEVDIAIAERDGRSLWISLIENPGSLESPRWTHIIEETNSLLDSNDIVFIDRLKKYKVGLNNQNEIDRSLIQSYFTQLDNARAGQYDNLDPDVIKFHEILYNNLGNNDLFTNSGFTAAPDGGFGLREWLLYKPESGFEMDDMRNMENLDIISNIELKW